ncbi:hypothetical protein CEUSTIGMA_g8732.t1 [Chlamydomonas eustigma]|uniref:JmjC domain-containing protein n=1 Tax=Chlamydomonas eustigma TaxID=1157962 RepID=A0A250XE21_9CHLO|nr:hypothetical protein CEUSTIGMA_g8732.t1 [Chlamydomonas eustigma]|eukprot:GAX81301.1 hypothetical protein CEUSTIGMA_g8732.t1 [Chlamydomonas eustigma]
MTSHKHGAQQGLHTNTIRPEPSPWGLLYLGVGEEYKGPTTWGHHLKRRLYSDGFCRNRVTANCHLCNKQHIRFSTTKEHDSRLSFGMIGLDLSTSTGQEQAPDSMPDATNPCSQSFCMRCVQKILPELDYYSASHPCLKCRGKCPCKKCKQPHVGSEDKCKSLRSLRSDSRISRQEPVTSIARPVPESRSGLDGPCLQHQHINPEACNNVELGDTTPHFNEEHLASVQDLEHNIGEASSARQDVEVDNPACCLVKGNGSAGHQGDPQTEHEESEVPKLGMNIMVATVPQPVSLSGGRGRGRGTGRNSGGKLSQEEDHALECGKDTCAVGTSTGSMPDALQQHGLPQTDIIVAPANEFIPTKSITPELPTCLNHLALHKKETVSVKGSQQPVALEMIRCTSNQHSGRVTRSRGSTGGTVGGTGQQEVVDSAAALTCTDSGAPVVPLAVSAVPDSASAVVTEEAVTKVAPEADTAAVVAPREAVTVELQARKRGRPCKAVAATTADSGRPCKAVAATTADSGRPCKAVAATTADSSGVPIIGKPPVTRKLPMTRKPPPHAVPAKNTEPSEVHEPLKKRGKGMQTASSEDAVLDHPASSTPALLNPQPAGLVSSTVEPKPKLPSWERLYTEEGHKWHGVKTLGAQVQRNFLYSDCNGQQKVTKACHFCQNQHIYVPCGTDVETVCMPLDLDGLQPLCSKSYCTKCIDNHFPHLLYVEAYKACPSCRTICSCRVCMRKQAARAVGPVYSDATKKLLSQHALRHLSTIICDLLEMEDWASVQLGYSCLEEVPWQDLHKERVLCDKCATSIANFHVSCPACGWDVCVKCLQESWTTSQQSQLHIEDEAASTIQSCGREESCHSQTWPCCLNPSCLNPSCDSSPLATTEDTWPLKAKRFFHIGSIKALRKVCEWSRGLKSVPLEKDGPLPPVQEVQGGQGIGVDMNQGKQEVPSARETGARVCDSSQQSADKLLLEAPNQLAALSASLSMLLKEDCEQMEQPTSGVVKKKKKAVEPQPKDSENPKRGRNITSSQLPGSSLGKLDGEAKTSLLGVPVVLEPQVAGIGGLQQWPAPSGQELMQAEAAGTLPERDEHIWAWDKYWVRAQDVRLASWAIQKGSTHNGEAAGIESQGTQNLVGVHQPSKADRIGNDADLSPCTFTPNAVDVRAVPPRAVCLPTHSLSSQLLFCPHANSLKPSSPDFQLYLLIFMEQWEGRRPVIVRGCHGVMRWTPEVMMRACRDLKDSSADSKTLQVLHCNGRAIEEMRQSTFFQKFVSQQEEAYTREIRMEGHDDVEEQPMLKVKDWPQDDHFSLRLVRHNQDFLEMLPLPFYTLPKDSPLNLASMMPSWSNATDLGPKTYVAFGRAHEHEDQEGDSVTKLHQDMSDAVNINVHVQYAVKEEPPVCRFGLEPAVRGSDYGRAGAVWEIWRVEDSELVRMYLREHLAEFKNRGERLHEGNVHDVVFDHCCMVSSRHQERMARGDWTISASSLREQLHDTTSGSQLLSCSEQRSFPAVARPVLPWHFEQHQDEAVFIPGGCLHQVRNLRGCIKVAVDFVSPECLTQCQIMSERLRRCPQDSEEPPYERAYQDKLQANMIIMAAAVEHAVTVQPELRSVLKMGETLMSSISRRPWQGVKQAGAIELNKKVQDVDIQRAAVMFGQDEDVVMQEATANGHVACEEHTEEQDRLAVKKRLNKRTCSERRKYRMIRQDSDDGGAGDDAEMERPRPSLAHPKAESTRPQRDRRPPHRYDSMDMDLPNLKDSEVVLEKHGASKDLTAPSVATGRGIRRNSDNGSHDVASLSHQRLPPESGDAQVLPVQTEATAPEPLTMNGQQVVTDVGSTTAEHCVLSGTSIVAASDVEALARGEGDTSNAHAESTKEERMPSAIADVDDAFDSSRKPLELSATELCMSCVDRPLLKPVVPHLSGTTKELLTFSSNLDVAMGSVTEMVLPRDHTSMGSVTESVLPPVHTSMGSVTETVLPRDHTSMGSVTETVLPPNHTSLESVTEIRDHTSMGSVTETHLPRDHTSMGSVTETVLPPVHTGMGSVTEMVLPRDHTSMGSVTEIRDHTSMGSVTETHLPRDHTGMGSVTETGLPWGHTSMGSVTETHLPRDHTSMGSVTETVLPPVHTGMGSVTEMVLPRDHGGSESGQLLARPPVHLD